MQFNLGITEKSGDISVNPPSHTSSGWIILFKNPRVDTSITDTPVERCALHDHWVFSII